MVHTLIMVQMAFKIGSLIIFLMVHLFWLVKMEVLYLLMESLL